MLVVLVRGGHCGRLVCVAFRLSMLLSLWEVEWVGGRCTVVDVFCDSRYEIRWGLLPT